MSTEQRYLLTEDEFYRISELCSCLNLAIEKVVLNAKLPRKYGWKHPAISGYEGLVEDELNRKESLPSLDEIF